MANEQGRDAFQGSAGPASGRTAPRKQDLPADMVPITFKKRSNDGSQRDKMGLDWHESATGEFNAGKDEYGRSLRAVAERLTHDRRATLVTDGDVRLARNILSALKPPSRGVIIGRCASVLGIFFGGTLFNRGHDENDLTIIIAGVILAIMAAVLEQSWSLTRK